MLRVNLFGFYSLAAKLQPLHALPSDASYEEAFFPLMQARWELWGLLENTIVPVKTCRGVAGELAEAITAVVPADIADAVAHRDAGIGTVSAVQIYRIQKALRDFEAVLKEELSLADTYAVAQKGAYSTAELITNSCKMLPVSVQASLPPQATSDFNQAGRCFAFETFTAAAFHLFRAIEAVMAIYFKHVTGKKKPTNLRNWWVYIETMRKSKKADDKILQALDHIRDKYRNPITHPDESVDADQVLVLFGLAVSVMSLMASAVAKTPKRSKAKKTGPP
jgi:hypothetical protein